MRRKRPPISPSEMLLKLKSAALNPVYVRAQEDVDEIKTIDERISKIISVINSPLRQIGNMLFFVMYDIESNKVRHQVVKYLQRMGCHRVQRSIFLADINKEKYQQIREDLVKVQAMYDNHDSILICPVSTDLIRNMKVIGKNINIDIIMHSKSTLFF